jgi:hypothetical protein
MSPPSLVTGSFSICLCYWSEKGFLASKGHHYWLEQVRASKTDKNGDTHSETGGPARLPAQVAGQGDT